MAMAKKRGSRSRSASAASSASTLSCINVATRESSVSGSASPSSTPPTSVPETNTEDGGSIKQASVSDGLELERSTTRPSTRPRHSNASHDPDRLSVLKTAHGSGTRDFSGETLVEHGDEASSSTPARQQRLLGESIKALDMDWEITSIPSHAPAAAGSSSRRGRRNSVTMDKMTQALGKIKSTLGKRGREVVDSGKEMLGLKNKRQSGRISRLEQERADSKARDIEGEDEADDTSVAEPPSKKAKLLEKLKPDFTGSSGRSSIFQGKTRKQFQKQGLYVGMDELFDPHLNKSKQRVSSIASSVKTITNSALPLPMFKKLDRDQDFIMPFDVFAPTFRAKGYERPRDWSKVARNRFVGDAKELWRDMKLAPSFCICKPPAPGELGCDDGCINRVMDYECDDTNCMLGPELCTNRAFADLAQRTKKANEFDIGVEVVKTQDRGFGVRANRCFGPGQIIVEYSGEVITSEESDRRMNEHYKENKDYYLMYYDQGMIIDATKGSVARFVNHSCEPNCAMVKRTVAGAPRMALFAGDKGVVTGEELTYDYNFDPYSDDNVQTCRCGAENCRGFLGPRPKDLPRPKKEKVGVMAGLKRKAVEVLGGGASDESRDRLVVKKRKTIPLPRGWAYVDPKEEQRRLDEDAVAKHADTTRLESGVARTRGVKQERRASRGGGITKTTETEVKATARGTTKTTETEIKATAAASDLKELGQGRKSSLLARATSVLKSARDALDDEGGGGGGKVLLLRQSTISFPNLASETLLAGRQDGGGGGGSLRRAASSAKGRLMGTVSKRGTWGGRLEGTVRLVSG